MSQKMTLKAQLRSPDEKPSAVRASGLIPATIYGHNRESDTVSVDSEEFISIYKEGGQTTMVDVEIEGGNTVPTLIHQFQRNPITGEFLNIEFYRVRMTKELETEIPLEIVGEAPALKLGGNLFISLQELEVRCLPQNLLPQIEVDISGLEQIDDGIFVKDLSLPDNLEILADPDELVVKVLPPQKEEEEEEEDAVEVEPELIGKEDSEEEGEESPIE